MVTGLNSAGTVDSQSIVLPFKVVVVVLTGADR